MPKDAALEREVERQVALIGEGALEVITADDLRAKLRRSLAAGQPLKVKLGADPTAPDIHLGHTVVLDKLRDFQQLGHQVIFVIGDFTGLIGDPSGRSKTRPALSAEEVRANAATYADQVFKILDPARTVIEYNSRWSDPLTFADVIRLAAKYTLARMLERDDFGRRLEEGAPVGLHELLYPLAQAYDSVALAADVELGASDQRFNLMVAREIQREYGQPPEVAVILPLLVGTDGVQKMSKSLDNYVGIADPPAEIYGKLMSLADPVMFDYLATLRLQTPEELTRLRDEVAAGRRHPKAVKQEMARRLVARYYDEAAARAAEAAFERVHREHRAPEDMAAFTLPTPAMKVVDVVVAAGLAPSKSEARRLVAQRAVTLDGEVVADGDAERKFAGGEVLKVGKRRFVRLALP
jgi:tyrosyl-tRNA synthetase